VYNAPCYCYKSTNKPGEANVHTHITLLKLVNGKSLIAPFGDVKIVHIAY